MHFLGIDIGGTKISVSLGDSQGKILENTRFETQPLKGAKNGVKAILETAKKLIQKCSVDISAIGISSPGPISYKEGKMLNPPNLKGWENTPLVKLVEAAFKKPTFMNNDANAAAAAEYEFGHAKGTKNLVYLTASTGMGGGIIVDGKLVQGISDTAGEVGHFILDVNGPKCPCGLRGCFEVYCGGASLAKRIQLELQDNPSRSIMLDLVAGEIQKIDMIVFIEAVRKKDAFALKIWDEFVLRLAQGIGTILMVLNPEVVILGTIAIHTKDLLFAPLKKQLKNFAWPQPLSTCKIEASRIGDKIDMLSSLALAIEGLKEG